MNNNNNRKILFTILSISMYKQKNLYKGNALHFSLKVCKKLVSLAVHSTVEK